MDYFTEKQLVVALRYNQIRSIAVSDIPSH
jgi:hypothetical protein